MVDLFLLIYGVLVIWWFISSNYHGWACDIDIWKMKRRKKKGIPEKFHRYKDFDQMMEDLKIKGVWENIYWTIRRYWIWFWDIPRDVHRAIKRFYQRGRRGWADEDVWCIASYLIKVVPGMLKRLRKIKHGIPMAAFAEEGKGEYGNHTDEQFKEAEKVWDEIMGKMIKTFEMAYNILDNDWFYQKSENWSQEEADKFDDIWKKPRWKYKPVPRSMTKKECQEYEEGWRLFQEHFYSLWD